LTDIPEYLFREAVYRHERYERRGLRATIMIIILLSTARITLSLKRSISDSLLTTLKAIIPVILTRPEAVGRAQINVVLGER